MKCVYIDPGVQYLAWALFNEDVLDSAGVKARELASDLRFVATRGEIERPWGKGPRTTQADIDDLNIACGEYGAQFPFRTYRRPYTAPKALRHARALAALTKAELAVLPKQKTKLKHVLCAVYMGLRATGRIAA